MTTTATTTVMIALFGLSAGCASSANLVRQDSLGGRVELRGAYMPSMADARLVMAEHCGGQVDATELSKAVEFRCRGAEPLQGGLSQLAIKRADARF